MTETFIIFRDSDNFINASALLKHYGFDWCNLKRGAGVQEKLHAVALNLNKSMDELVSTRKGSRTFVHMDIAKVALDYIAGKGCDVSQVLEEIRVRQSCNVAVPQHNDQIETSVGTVESTTIISPQNNDPRLLLDRTREELKELCRDASVVENGFFSLHVIMLKVGARWDKIVATQTSKTREVLSSEDDVLVPQGPPHPGEDLQGVDSFSSTQARSISSLLVQLYNTDPTQLQSFDLDTFNSFDNFKRVLLEVPTREEVIAWDAAYKRLGTGFPENLIVYCKTSLNGHPVTPATTWAFIDMLSQTLDNKFARRVMRSVRGFHRFIVEGGQEVRGIIDRHVNEMSSEAMATTRNPNTVYESKLPVPPNHLTQPCLYIALIINAIGKIKIGISDNLRERYVAKGSQQQLVLTVQVVLCKASAMHTIETTWKKYARDNGVRGNNEHYDVAQLRFLTGCESEAYLIVLGMLYQTVPHLIHYTVMHPMDDDRKYCFDTKLLDTVLIDRRAIEEFKRELKYYNGVGATNKRALEERPESPEIKKMRLQLELENKKIRQMELALEASKSVKDEEVTASILKSVFS